MLIKHIDFQYRNYSLHKFAQNHTSLFKYFILIVIDICEYLFHYNLYNHSLKFDKYIYISRLMLYILYVHRITFFSKWFKIRKFRNRILQVTYLFNPSRLRIPISPKKSPASMVVKTLPVSLITSKIPSAIMNISLATSPFRHIESPGVNI